MKPSKQAYIWTREHSTDRLRVSDRVQSAWINLFFEPSDHGHYLPIQYAPPAPWDDITWKQFKATLDGKEIEAHLTVIRPVPGSCASSIAALLN